MLLHLSHSSDDGKFKWTSDDIGNNHMLTSAVVYANNDMGAVTLNAQDYVNGIQSSVETSYVDKNIVLTSLSSGHTRSSLEVSDGKQNIYMVAKDDTDGTRSTINVNNRDDNKRVFITARNDNNGTRSVIEISDKEEHVYLESSDLNVKTYLTVTRKDKNITLFVEAEESATSFQVTNKEVTIDGKRVLTQDDLDALSAPQPPKRRPLFWWLGR